MSQLIIFLLGIVVGAVGVWIVDSRFHGNDKKGSGSDKGGRVINPEQVRVRRENLEKVVEMAREKGEIANDDVEKELGVSDATAQRYLQELESQGKLVQIGTRGKYVKYAISNASTIG